MDAIQRLSRRAKLKSTEEPLVKWTILLLKSDSDELRERLDLDRMDSTVLFEAVCKGYIERHPAVLAMIDDWIRERDRQLEERSGVLSKKRARLIKREVSAIYDAVGSGAVED